VNARRARKRYARRLRLERTPEYRQSLQRLLDLGGQLQSVLDTSQRERWLALEEALFEHSSHLQRAYFRAGVEYGRSRAVEALVSNDEAQEGESAERSRAAAARASANAESAALELQIVSALARWLGKL
jgi:hypothetical protein